MKLKDNVTLVKILLKINTSLAGIVMFIVAQSYWKEPAIGDPIVDIYRSVLFVLSAISLALCFSSLFVDKRLTRAAGALSSGFVLTGIGLSYLFLLPFNVFTIFLLGLGLQLIASGGIIHFLPQELKSVYLLNTEIDNIEQEILRIKQVYLDNFDQDRLQNND